MASVIGIWTWAPSPFGEVKSVFVNDLRVDIVSQVIPIQGEWVIAFGT